MCERLRRLDNDDQATATSSWVVRDKEQSVAAGHQQRATEEQGAHREATSKALAVAAANFPMPRDGAFRCRLKNYHNCAVGTCKGSKDNKRAHTSCPCYQTQRCSY